MTNSTKKINFVTLDDIAEQKPNAIVDGPFGSNLKVSDYVDDGIPVIQGKNITGNKFQWADIRYISELKAEELSRSKVNIHDILMIKIGSIGYSAILDDLKGYPFAIIPANLAKISPDSKKVDSRFLLHWLTSPIARRKLIGLASKTAQPALSLSKIKNFPFPLLPLSEQKRIAAILDKADALRQKRKQSLQLLDDFIRSVFLDMFGDPGQNLKKWKTQELGELIAENDKINYGVVQPGSDYPNGVPIIRVKDFGDMVVDKSELKRIDPAIEKNYKRTRLKGDELLIACVGSIGRIVLVDESCKGFNIVRATARVRCSMKIDRIYLAYYLSTPYIQTYFQNSTRTVSQPTLNIKQIQETKIVLPPIELQKNFAAIVEKVQVMRIKMINSNDCLDNQFNSIVQRAFRGEL